MKGITKHGYGIGMFELKVLLAVLKLEGIASSKLIAEKISKASSPGKKVSLGAVYTTLGVLAKAKLIGFEKMPNRKEPFGRRAKAAILTPKGRKELHTVWGDLRTLANGTLA